MNTCFCNSRSVSVKVTTCPEGGWVQGKTKIMQYSTLVEVEVEVGVELSKICKRGIIVDISGGTFRSKACKLAVDQMPVMHEFSANHTGGVLVLCGSNQVHDSKLWLPNIRKTKKCLNIHIEIISNSLKKPTKSKSSFKHPDYISGTAEC